MDNEAKRIAEGCEHQFILIVRTTEDIPVPYYRCSRCGCVRTYLEQKQ